MKKLISMLLALAMALSMMGAAVAEGESVTLYLVGAATNGMLFAPDTLGMDMSFVLNADGTGTATATTGAEPEQSDCTWVEDETQVTITVDGDAMTFVANEEGILVGEMSGVAMYLSLTDEPLVKSYVPAAPKADAALEDFNGAWVTTLAEAYGMQMIMMNQSMSLAFVDGTGVLTVAQGENTVQGNVTGVLQEVNMEDGTAVSALVLTNEDQSSTMMMMLLEDGVISFTEASTGVVFYFEQVVVDETAETAAE